MQDHQTPTQDGSIISTLFEMEHNVLVEEVNARGIFATLVVVIEAVRLACVQKWDALTLDKAKS